MKHFGQILTSSAFALMISMTAAARADDDVRLRLNWMYYGSHAGFAYGKDKGFYKDNGIKDIKDLKGKTLLTTANAGVNTFFPIVLANAGLQPDDINLINAADGALVSSYLQAAGGAVGMLGGLDDKPSEIKANGGQPPLGLPIPATA